MYPGACRLRIELTHHKNLKLLAQSLNSEQLNSSVGRSLRSLMLHRTSRVCCGTVYPLRRRAGKASTVALPPPFITVSKCHHPALRFE